MASIELITVTQVNGVSPSSTINLGLDDASEIKASPHGENNQNGVTFSIEIEGTQAELAAQNQVYYQAYTKDQWSHTTNQSQLIGGLNSSVVGFSIPVQQGNTYKATGALTLYFPEKLAGAQVAICFGLTEHEAGNTVTPGINTTLHKKVKYLHIASSVDNTPLIHNVHWSTIEAIVFGEETAERTDICFNEDAFLHIHTRGLFGESVTVELYGQSNAENTSESIDIDENDEEVGELDNLNATDGQNTSQEANDIMIEMTNNQSILLKQRKYKIKDNVLCITFPTNEVSRIFYPAGQNADQQLFIEARVTITGVNNEMGTRVVSAQMEICSDEAEYPTTASTEGTMKYIIGNPVNRPVEVEPTNPLPEDLNVHVGTLTFLSGDGTESTNSIIASVADTSLAVDAGSRYYTYQMDTYELRLQDFIDAGILEKDDVINTTTNPTTGEQTESLNDSRIYAEDYISGSTTTKIHGFTDAYRRIVHSKISTNSRQANVDYAKVQKLKEAAIANSRTVVDTRRMCRSGWQLRTRRNQTTTQFHRYKDSPFRYSTNQECPCGAYFLTPPRGGSFLIFVGDTPTTANVTHWTTTTRVENPTNREEIKKPNSTYTDYVASSRDGIALHRGRCISSVGCITLDENWNDTGKDIERALFNSIFSGTNGEYQEMTNYNPKADRPKKGNAALKLHLIMIEERNGILRSDADTANFHPKNRYKGE